MILSGLLIWDLAAAVEMPFEKLQYHPMVDESSVVQEKARSVERENGSEYKQGMESVIDPKPSNIVKDDEIKEETEQQDQTTADLPSHHCTCVKQ